MSYSSRARDIMVREGLTEAEAWARVGAEREGEEARAASTSLEVPPVQTPVDFAPCCFVADDTEDAA